MRALRAAVWASSAAAIAGAGHAAGNRRHLRHLSRAPVPGVTFPVSALVPARDEAATIAALVTDLVAQVGVPDLQIVVLDDDSTDETGRIALAAAGGDPRVEVVRQTEGPPPGWLGKPHACRSLAERARGEVLVFIDADVRLHPAAVAAAVADLDRTGSTMLSAWPRQLAATALADLLQPIQQWSWLTTLPLGVAARSRRATMAAANGQFLVFDRAGYEQIGGHATVADQVLEDISLARAVKRAGLRADLVDAAAVAECLMYRTDAELVDGYQKSLWSSFGGPLRSVAGTSLLAAGYLLPVGYAFFGRHRPTRVAGAIGYAGAVANRVITARATGDAPWPSSAAHPLAMAVVAGLTAASAARRRFGVLTWRGRPV